MSRPQRAAASRAQTYREASDSEDGMQDDDEAPLSSLQRRPRSAASHSNGALSRRTAAAAPQLNDEIDEDAEHDGAPASPTFTAESKEEVVLLDEDEEGYGEPEQKQPSSSSGQWKTKPQQRSQYATARAPPARRRTSEHDPLQEEVEAEEDDGEEEFAHESVFLPHRARTASSRASPSPPLRSARPLSSAIELRRSRPAVDYRKTKIDRQSMYTPDAWKKADRQHNAAGGARGAHSRAASRGRKQYDDDLFEPDDEKQEEEAEAEADADEEVEAEEVAEDEEDVLSFSRYQQGSRRSERTLGKKKVDYTSHALDEAVRDARIIDRSGRQRHTKGRRSDEVEQMEDEVEQAAFGEDDEVQPMTDSDAEGYEGRRRQQPIEEEQAEEEAEYVETDEDIAFRLQAEQYMKDELFPSKLLALRKVAVSASTTSQTPPDRTPAFSASSPSTAPATSFEYLVKWRERAYKHSVWLDERLLAYFPTYVTAQMTRLRNSLAKDGVDINTLSAYSAERRAEAEDGTEVELEDNQYYNPDFNVVHRVVSHDPKDGRYLVKWKGLGYDELTWESVADIDNDAEIERYHRYSTLPASVQPIVPRAMIQPRVRMKVEELTFENDRELREYQKEGVSWMCFNWLQNRRPSLLADEMGLGKTAQAIAVCRYMQQYHNMRGPFLVVAPLSTVGHWQREFEAWTDMNAVVYHGTQEARDNIHKYEFRQFEHDGRPKQHRYTLRFNVLIVPDSLVKMEKQTLLKIQWVLMVLDEGHRIKNHNSLLANTLSQVDCACKILLTGTPIQNHLGELWSVLHFLDSLQFPSEEDFVSEYGEVANGSTERLEALQQRIEPYFLRRIKEDVEKNIPPRRETLIEVDMSRSQKLHYKALYEKDVSKLMRGKGADMPSLLNLQMQLRKCCQHPFLLKGAEDTAMQQARLRKDDHAAILQLLVEQSGKFVLLKKMLDSLKQEGRRVLLFSQMTRLLDLVEDAVRHWQFAYERIDGAITGNARQAAIDRFCRPNSDRFVFLLSTKAGGLGLNLQVADTIIIFDSDWNPQNDLQAIARSHRIGQTKEVQVYRLIARKTYENEMFERASRKLGLGHAIMGTMQASSPFAPTADSGVDRVDKAELELMLRKGYYHQAVDPAAESTQLNEDTIEQIMQRDAKVIEYRSTSAAAVEDEVKESADGGASSDRGGSNRFAKASFVTAESEAVGDWSDAGFWSRMFPDAAVAMADGLLDDTILTGKRKRHMLHGSYQHLLQGDQTKTKKQRSNSPMVDDVDDEFRVDSQVASDDDSVVSDESAVSKKGIQQPASVTCKRSSPFAHGLQSLLEDSLCRFGYGRWREIRADMRQRSRDKLILAADIANKNPSLGQMPVNEASLIASQVDRVSVDDIRAYSVGWLKMCYLYSKHKALYASDSEGDSDDDTASRKKLRKRFSDDGLELELHQSALLADDARQLIEAERQAERARRLLEKKRLEKQKALAAIDEVQNMANIARSKSPQPSIADTQTLTAKVEPTAKIEPASSGAQSNSFLDISAVKNEVKLKLEHGNGVKAEGADKATVKGDEAEEDEEEEEQLDGMSFLELFPLIPVDASLLMPHQQKHMKQSSKQFLGVLQLLHTLDWYVVLAEDSVQRSHPPDDCVELKSMMCQSGKGGKSARLQWLYEHMRRWWRPDDDWWLLLGLRLHGLDQFDAIRDDARLPFAARLGKQETVKFDNTYSDEYKRAHERFQQIYDNPKVSQIAKTTEEQKVKRLRQREEVVQIVWPDKDALVAYSRKLLSGVRKVRKNTAVKRAKEQERQKRDDKRRLEQEAEMEADRRRMEEDAKRDERKRKRKAEKRAAKEAARQKERDDEQRMRDGKSKADKSLEQMVAKRNGGERSTAIEPEDFSDDEDDVGPHGKQRNSSSSNKKSHRSRHKTDELRVHSPSSASSKSAAQSSTSQMTLSKYFLNSPSQRKKPLPLISADEPSHSPAPTPSPSVASTAPPVSVSSKLPRYFHTVPASKLAAFRPKPKPRASRPPSLFAPSPPRADSSHPGFGVRPVQWRADNGHEEDGAESSMDEDDDEGDMREVRRAAAQFFSAASAKPPSATKPQAKQSGVISIDSD